MEILYDSRYPGDYEKHYGLWRPSDWWAHNGLVFGTGIQAYAVAQCAVINEGEMHDQYEVRSFEDWFETMEAPEQ